MLISLKNRTKKEKKFFAHILRLKFVRYKSFIVYVSSVSIQWTSDYLNKQY